jgi:hypothetical protein
MKTHKTFLLELGIGFLLGALGPISALAQDKTPAAAATAPPVTENLQLFLLIGQSNMSGRGVVEAQDSVPISRVFALNKDLEWVPAVDPVQLEVKSGVGMGRSFARVLAAENPSVSIGLVPAAVGATYLSEWVKGDDHYENAVRRAKAAMKSGRLRGILWHQGEGDSQTQVNALTYGTRWTQFINDLRADLGDPNLPVVIGELCRSIYRRPNGESRNAYEVNMQLATLPLTVPRCVFVASDGLKDKGDFVHFDAASQREFGRRYAHAFLQLDPGWSTIEPH